MNSKLSLKFSAAYVLLLITIALGGCSKEPETTPRTNTTNNQQTRTADSLRNAKTDSLTTVHDSLFDNVKIVAADSVQNAAANKSAMNEDTRDKIRSSMNKVFSHYIDIKDELFDNDSADAQKHAKELISVIMDEQTEIGEQNIAKKWRLSNEKIKDISAKIQDAGTLSAQRTLFKTLSESMFDAIKEYGLDGKTVYQLSCADALSGKGGTWLTDDKDSDNPYAGKNNTDIKSKSCVKISGAWKYE